MDKIKVMVTRGDAGKQFGKVARLELPDKSKIYISKKGWNLVTPQGIEVNIPFNEINLAIEETIRRGYVIKETQHPLNPKS